MHSLDEQLLAPQFPSTTLLQSVTDWQQTFARPVLPAQPRSLQSTPVVETSSHATLLS
jgi:hypothetical protein